MSSVIVRIPTPLRGFAGGNAEIAAEGADVGAVLSAIGAEHPELLERVMKDDGQPREFVNIYLGSDNVRTLEGMDTPVAEGDVLSILPAVAGGREGRYPVLYAWIPPFHALFFLETHEYIPVACSFAAGTTALTPASNTPGRRGHERACAGVRQ